MGTYKCDGQFVTFCAIDVVNLLCFLFPFTDVSLMYEHSLLDKNRYVNHFVVLNVEVRFYQRRTCTHFIVQSQVILNQTRSGHE